MIIDFHVHLGDDQEDLSLSPEELNKLLDENGVNYVCVFPFSEPDMVKSSLKILELAKKNKRFLPFLRFDPKTIKVEGLRDLLKKDFYGIKLQPSTQRFDPLNKKFFPLYKEIEKNDFLILFHSLGGDKKTVDPMRIIKLIKHFPKLKIVLAHTAGHHPEVYKEIKKNKNLYFETSFAQPNIKEVILEAGVESALFGSDTPYSDQKKEILKIKNLDISERDKQRIFYENAKKLLNL